MVTGVEGCCCCCDTTAALLTTLGLLLLLLRCCFASPDSLLYATYIYKSECLVLFVLKLTRRRLERSHRTKPPTNANTTTTTTHTATITMSKSKSNFISQYISWLTGSRWSVGVWRHCRRDDRQIAVHVIIVRRFSAATIVHRCRR